tara:strand:- start:4763 stop:5080 length:318 start_codon:yes stop_codon:yes gene_type:complete
MFDQKFNKATKNFMKYRVSYKGSNSTNEIFRYALLAEESLDEAQKYYKIRKRGVFGTVITYLLHLTDGIISKPKGGLFKPRSFDSYFDYNSINLSYDRIKISKDF